MKIPARTLALIGTGVAAAITAGVILAWPSGSHPHRAAPRAATSTLTARTGAKPTPAAASPAAVVPAAATATPVLPALNFADPVAVASAYTTAAMSLDWHWDSAAGYLPVIQPLSTPAHWANDLAPMADAPSGATFQDAKAGHVMWTVTVNFAAVIQAAPKSATSCWVRVAYTVLLSGDQGRPGGVPNLASLNLGMQLIDGRWLVNKTTTDGG